MKDKRKEQSNNLPLSPEEEFLKKEQEKAKEVVQEKIEYENLSEEDGEIFQRLINNQATDEDMAKIPKVFEKSDNYCLENRELHRADKTDSKMHNSIWREAAKLRTNGELLKSFKQIKSKIVLIQGENDPHPARGLTIPFKENAIDCETYILEKCGHSPFMEKYAKEIFYKILQQIIV